eukprot:TRINITY_DN25925_c0_g1_i1.p1 TRINITY_DN25925_c0_g1~~TRINITY_DN25925_c0_g1_i1.p1  ORF type:complete len:127 (+),score=41.37 TRINITY_DN25925_c0_g1_i1:64-444(+)
MFYAMHQVGKHIPRAAPVKAEDRRSAILYWGVVGLVGLLAILLGAERYLPREIGLLGLCAVVKALREVVHVFAPPPEGHVHKGRIVRMLEGKNGKQLGATKRKSKKERPAQLAEQPAAAAEQPAKK